MERNGLLFSLSIDYADRDKNAGDFDARGKPSNTRRCCLSLIIKVISNQIYLFIVAVRKLKLGSKKKFIYTHIINSFYT